MSAAPPAAPLFRKSRRFTTDGKSTRLNSSHGYISYAVFCLKKKPSHHLAADADDLALSAAMEIVEVAVELLAIGRRHQHLDVLSYRLVRPVSEQPLALRIER